MILLLGGIIFLCGGIYFFCHGIHTYLQQINQKDWEITTATVISTAERLESSGGTRRSRHYYTVYDIYYQYEADGNIYTDMIYGSNAAKSYGETFEIKFDPLEPQNSTCDLEPNFHVVISGAVGFLIFGTIGLHMTRCAIPLRKKRWFGQMIKPSGQQ